jgi:Ca2+-binding RTX toxin-like protein
MVHLRRVLQTLLPSLAAVVALAAAGAPTASADVSRAKVWLNEQAGVLSITGSTDRDIVWLHGEPSAKAPGGYVLVVNIKNSLAADFSANCSEGGGFGDWVVTCPALNVKRITFDGGPGQDEFANSANLPSEAHGGPDGDHLAGGFEPDILDGDEGNDNLDGGQGDDTLDGGAGTDHLTGGLGNDIASWADAQAGVVASLDGYANDGTAGENENIPTDVEGIQGGPYDDQLSGGPGNAALPQNNTLKGQGGNDTLHADPGADVLDGGPDSDTLSYAAAGQSVYVYQDGGANDGPYGEHDNVTSIENLTGSPYGDDLQGTPGDDVIKGGAGGDKIEAFFGDDTVYGGDGPDNIIAGPGAPTDCGNLPCTKFDTDKLYGGSGDDTVDYSERDDNLTIAIDGSRKSGGFMENDTLTAFENANGGGGNDTIYGNDASNSLTGNGGGDGIDGKGGNDYVSGGPGNDFVAGGPGNNWVVGGEDDDTLYAVGGNDTLWGASGHDTVSYWGATSGVTARIGTGTSGQVGESDTIHGDVEDLQGSIYGDTLVGNGAANHLWGLAGADKLVGGGGADTLDGGEGPDTLNSVGDATQDHSTCGAGADTANADKIDIATADCETVNKT